MSPDEHAELKHLIRELREFAAIRNTHTGIKAIASRLSEILTDILDAGHRANTITRTPANVSVEAQDVLRQHEAIMADLVRVSGTQDEAANGTTSSGGSTGKLISYLVDHWDAVGVALGLTDHPPPPPCPLGTGSPMPSTQYDMTSNIDSRLSEQVSKIEQILTIFKSLESKIENKLGTTSDSDTHHTNDRTKTNKKGKHKNKGSRASTTSLDTADRDLGTTSTRTISRYNAIYGTPTTDGSPISRQHTPGPFPAPAPSLLLDDFPPLPTSSHLLAIPPPLRSEGGRKPPKKPCFLGGSLQNPPTRGFKPPALLVRGSKLYAETVKAIKDRIDPREFENAHFNKSRTGDLLIRFTNSQSVEEELKKKGEKN